MEIRPAQFEDALGMARVIVDTFLLTNRGLMSEKTLLKRRQEWTHEVSARNWEQALTEIAEGVTPHSCIYVAVEESGEVVGLAMGCPAKSFTEFSGAEDDSAGIGIGEVDILYVRESHQRQGIGRTLVQAVAAHLVQMGMPVLHICTPAAASQARRFYEKLGGRVVGTRDDYDDGELIPLVVYEWTDTRSLIHTEAVYQSD